MRYIEVLECKQCPLFENDTCEVINSLDDRQILDIIDDSSIHYNCPLPELKKE